MLQKDKQQLSLAASQRSTQLMLVSFSPSCRIRAVVKNQIKLLSSSRQTLDNVAQDTGKTLSYYVDTQCSMAQIIRFSKPEIGISMN